ncbi:MAG: hypothetical protein V7782_07090 [Psychromonas sp.]
MQIEQTQLISGFKKTRTESETANTIIKHLQLLMNYQVTAQSTANVTGVCVK